MHCKKQTLNSSYMLLISESVMWCVTFSVRPHGSKSCKRQMHCCIYMKPQAYGFLAADIDHLMHYIVYGLEFTVQT
jgi:hypothetical protein